MNTQNINSSLNAVTPCPKISLSSKDTTALLFAQSKAEAAVDPSAQQQKDARISTYKKSTVRTQFGDAEKRYAPEVVQRRERLALARTEYRQRHPKVPIGTSWILNASNHDYIDVDQRLTAYNKHHKCGHGRNNNEIEVVNTLSFDSTPEMKLYVPHYYTVSCNHAFQDLEDDVIGYCINCNHHSLHNFSYTLASNCPRVYSNCKCTTTVCVFCHVENYTVHYYDPFGSFYTKTAPRCLCHHLDSAFTLEQKLHLDFLKKNVVYKPHGYIAPKPQPAFNVWKRPRSSITRVPTFETVSAPFFNELVSLGTPHSFRRCPTPPSTPVPTPLEERTVESQGGVVSAARSTAESLVSICAKVCTGFVNMFKTIYDSMHTFCDTFITIAGIASTYNTIREFLAYIISKINAILLSLRDPMRMASMAAAVYALFKAETPMDYTVSLGTLFLLTMTIPESGTNNQSAPALSDADQVISGPSISTTSKFYWDKLLGFFTTTSTSTIHAQSGSFAFLYDYAKNVGRTSADTFFSILKWVSRVFLKNKGVFACFAIPMMSHLKDFNTIFTSGRNMNSIITFFSRFLPACIINLLQSSNPRAWLAAQLAKPDTEFRKLSDLAIAANAAGSLGQLDHEPLVDAFKAQLIVCQNYLSSHSIVVDDVILRYLKLVREVACAPAAARSRDREPFVIKISGASGLGKSTIWPAFISSLYPGLSSAQILAKVYSRNPGSDYWDGYLPSVHEIILYDDFNQSREETDLLEIIQLVSKAQYLPPFASLDSNNAGAGKGVQATPKLIILLSNTQDVDAITLHSNEAINRRYSLHFRMDWTSVNFNSTAKRVMKRDFSHATITLIASNVANISPTPNGQFMTIPVIQKTVWNAFLQYAQTNDSIIDSIDSFMVKDGDGMDTILAGYAHSTTDSPSRFLIREVEPQVGEAFIDYFTTHKTMIGIGSSLLTTYLQSLRTNIPVTGSKLLRMTMWLHPKLRFFFEDLRAQKVYNFLDSIISMLQSISVCCCAVATGWAFGSMLLLPKTPTAEAQSGESSTSKYHPRSIRSQAGRATDVSTLIKHNMCRIVLPDGRCNSALFVKGNIVLINAHLFLDLSYEATRDFIPDGTPMKVYFFSVAEPMTIPFSLERISAKSFDVRDKDLVCYKFPDYVAARKSLLHHFVNGELSYQNRSCFTLKHCPDLSIETHCSTILKDNLSIKYDLSPRGERKTYHQHSTFVYQMHGRAGDCGQPIILDDDLVTGGTILGIHVGGDSSNESIGLIVTSKFLLDTISSMEVVHGKTITKAEAQSGYVTLTEEANPDIQGSLIYHGKCTPPISIPVKTSLRRSPLHDKIWTHNTAPALLSKFHPAYKQADGTQACPLLRGINKYSSEYIPFNREYSQAAHISIKQEVYNIPSVSLRRALTLHEAINGVPGYPFMDRMDLSTSAGFPWAFTKFKGPKRNLFTQIEEDYFPIPELKKAIEAYIENCKNHVMNDDYFIDYLKDERRPLEKVTKPRMFSAASLVSVIVNRMYFLPFYAHFYQCAGKCFSSVGISKTSQEWHKMISRMTEVGTDNASGFDYSHYDGDIQFDAQLDFTDFCADWFQDNTPENLIIRKMIGLHATTHSHISGDLVWQTNDGNSTGFNATVVLNTYNNERNVRTCWQALAPPHFKDLYHYRRLVRTMMVGDDNVVNKHLDCASFFTPSGMVSFFALHNIVLTSATKDDNVLDESLFECSFLKCKTGQMNGLYVPLMDLSALQEMINWVRLDVNNNDANAACESNCNDMLRNMFYHGRAIFDDARSRILEHAPNYNLLSFMPLYMEFTQTGAISDPTNAFGYTRQLI